MAQTLMAMLPSDIRAALDGGASPQDLAQSLLMQRMQQQNDVVDSVASEVDEEPWPEVGWNGAGRPRQAVIEPAAEVEDVNAAGVTPALDQGVVSDLARAVGACSLCLGETEDCPVCAGYGSPGWSVPEPELFQIFVVPALRRLEAEELRQAQATAARFSGPLQAGNRNGNSTTS